MTGEGVGHWFFHQFVNEWTVQDGFIGQYDVWGVPQSLDWLDRTARKTAAQPIQSAASVEESYNVDDASLPSMSMLMFNGEDI